MKKRTKKWLIETWSEKDDYLGTRRVNKNEVLKLKGINIGGRLES